jgi:hypothetical protein
MDDPILEARLAADGSAHYLCADAFLQQRIFLPDVALVPLQPLGFDHEGNYLARYAAELMRAAVDADALKKLKTEGAQSRPILAIILQGLKGRTPEELELAAQPKFELVRTALSAMNGNELSPFGILHRIGGRTYFRALLGRPNKRYFLGPDTPADRAAQLARIMEAATDEHFRFAISLLLEANRDENPRFQIARYFACLEALAYRIKGGGRGSRKAISYMLGLPEPNRCNASFGGTTVCYDDLELARRVRDALFHGVRLVETDYPGLPAAVWPFLKKEPLHFVQELRARCELEVLKWANDHSLGRAVAEGRAEVLPIDHPAIDHSIAIR